MPFLIPLLHKEISSLECFIRTLSSHLEKPSLQSIIQWVDNCSYQCPKTKAKNLAWQLKYSSGVYLTTLLNGEALSHEVIGISDQSFKWAVWNLKLAIFLKWDAKVLTSSWAKGKVPGFFLIVDVPSCQGCLPAKSTSGWDLRWRPLLWSKLGNWRNSIDFVKLIKNKLGALQHPICCLCDQAAASYSQCYCSLKRIFPDIVGRLLASPL